MSDNRNGAGAPRADDVLFPLGKTKPSPGKRSVKNAVVRGIAQEIDAAMLPDGFGRDFANSHFKPRMIVSDDQLHAVKPARLEAAQEVAPARTESLERFLSDTTWAWNSLM
jgi:hypothetical protein